MSRATPSQSGRIPTHESERSRRLSLPAARAARPASSRPFPQPDPLPRLPSWELSPRSFVSLVEMSQGWKARSTSNARGHRAQPADLDSAGRPRASMGACCSRTNADDRLPLASLGPVEGGDGVVEGRDVADVRLQSSVTHPLDDLTQLGAIGHEYKVDRQAVGGPRRGRPGDGHQRSSGSNQACGPLPDVAADDIENQIDSADVFEDVVLEVDELLRAEVECLLTVGSASGADDVGAELTCELRHHRPDCAGRAVREDALPRLKTAMLEQSLPRSQARHRHARAHREVDVARQRREVACLDGHILCQGAAAIRVREAEHPLSHRQPRRAVAESGNHPGQLLPGNNRRPVTAEAIGPGRGPRQLIPGEPRRMNLNDDVVYRCLRLGPLDERHPGGSRSLVRYHDRLHDNFLLGHLSCVSVVWDSEVGFAGLTRKPTIFALGTSSRSNSSRFAPSEVTRKVTPVTLPPGRLRLETRPISTGSAPVAKTIGMVLVAALAATAAGGASATITATGSATSSAANPGSRSKRPSAVRYFIATLRPST